LKQTVRAKRKPYIPIVLSRNEINSILVTMIQTHIRTNENFEIASYHQLTTLDFGYNIKLSIDDRFGHQYNKCDKYYDRPS